MRSMILAATAAALATLTLPMPALADLHVAFVEGAPKDRFVFTNRGGCSLDKVQVTLDLSPSAGGLIFDVTGSGAGVEVFQPLEITKGAEFLTDIPEVRDGDDTLLLTLASLAPDATVAFTIDVDDTVGTRAITVSDAEITGAIVTLTSAGKPATGTFAKTAKTVVAAPACDS